MRLRVHITAISAVMLCISTLGACSSSGSTSKASDGGPSTPATKTDFTSPSGPARGFDGTTIKVAGIGIKSQLPSVETGAQARIGRFNRSNEIPGVKIEYAEYAEDNNDRATALSEARRLVAEEKVFGLVGDASAFNPLQYFQQQHVPYFGWAFDGTYCSKKPVTDLWGYSFTGCLIPDAPEVAPDGAANVYKYVAKKTGKAHPTVAIFSGDTPSGLNAVKVDKVSYEGAGFDVVLAKGMIPQQGTPVSDYTPYVQQLLRADNGKAPDTIFCALAIECVSIYALIQANNYPGTYLHALYTDQVVANMKGSIALASFVPFSENTPANTQLRADLKAVKPDQSPELGVSIGYFSTDMFIQALKAVVDAKGKSYISPDNVRTAASTMKWEISGQAGPTNYPDSTVKPTPLCSAIVLSDGKQWTTVEPYSCSDKTFPVNG